MKLNFWQILGLVLLVGGLVALMWVKGKPNQAAPADDMAATVPA
jgi:hypothetical protein